VDIDQQAVLATIDNAQRNGVLNRVVASTVAEMKRQAADVVLANILAEPLDQLAEELAGLVVAKGEIVLSGLLVTQAEALASRYAAWFDMTAPSTREDWARLTGLKR
jgi:ribosomal protein L11 methyltransferase